jgi:hypothetical protein
MIWATSPDTSRQNLFCPLVLQFCRRQNIKDNMKILLVWENDSYTGRFLVLLPCTCVLQPKLVHLYQTPSLLPSPLPIVASAVSDYYIHFYTMSTSATYKFLVSFPFPIFPMCVLPLVCDLCQKILLHLFWLYNLHMMENMRFLAFWA